LSLQAGGDAARLRGTLIADGQKGFHIFPEVNVPTPTTEGYIGWHLDITETSVGSGTLNAMQVDVDTTGTVLIVKNNGRMRIVNGSSATPAVSFISDADTGMFRQTTNELGFATAGSTIAIFNSTLDADADVGLHLTPTVDQAGAEGYQGLFLDITETAVGTGTREAFRIDVGAVPRFNVQPDLVQPTGDEIGINFELGINKATSGNYTAMRINVDETIAPGTNELLLALALEDTNRFEVKRLGHARTTAGTAATPAWGFTANDDLGIYRAGANSLGISTEGVAVAVLTQLLNETTGDEVGINLAVKVDKLTSGSYTGIKLDVTETDVNADNLLMDLQVDTVSQFTVDNGGIVVTQGQVRSIAGNANNAGHGFDGDANTGMYQVTTDVLGHTTGGVEWISIARDDQTVGAVTSQAITIALADDTVYWFEAWVIGRDQAGTDRAFYRRSLYAYREATGSATLGTALASDAAQETNANWDSAFSASGNNVRLDVTGDTGQTIDWRVLVRYQAVP
jgi:hypothetical protein